MCLIKSEINNINNIGVTHGLKVISLQVTKLIKKYINKKKRKYTCLQIAKANLVR